MADAETVDRHLAAVIDEVISAIQKTKQGVWSASTAEKRAALNELKGFLGEQLVALAEAEERINGRSSSITSPTGHAIRNLRSEAGNDLPTFKALLLEELRDVAVDARARAAEIAPASEAQLLTHLADGLDRRLDPLGA